MSESTPGQIFTFYSYKGGTGRSMALANVACLLADKWAEGEKILMIDWDLEAPGLHRFFDMHLKDPNSFEFDKRLGLIDMFIEFREACKKFSPSDEIPNSFFEDLSIDRFILDTDINNLFLMTAGQFDDLYPTKVNTFNWEELFNQNPRLISGFANYLATNFKYVLIDSRTGFTDISSICTSLMPEKLIVVFTPNKQSLTGVLGLVDRVTAYRKKSDDLRPLVVFPLPSRIENAELELQKDWRFGNKKNRIDGYQAQFESILNQVYDLPAVDLTDYFDDIQIQYVPRYSYGEEISVLSDRSEDRLSLSRSYENFANSLVNLESPWEYQRVSAGDSSLVLSGNIKGSNVIIGNANVSNIYISGSDNIFVGDKVGSRQLRIFLSHASQDKPLVRDLYYHLVADGYKVWFDEKELLPGQDWDMEIEKAVSDSDVVIVCLSDSSVTKEGYIQKELRFALDLALEKAEGEIFVIPIRLNECEVPRRIRSWHYVDYFPKERRDMAYDRLRESLEIRAKALGITPVERKRPAKVFISYSHKDEQFKDDLVTLLAGLQHRGAIEIWQDRRIEVGDEWYQSIQKAMRECDLAVLLISSDFIASRFVQDEQLLNLLKRRSDEGLRIVPIIVRPCLWQSEPLLKETQALPRDGKPLVSFSVDNGERDQVWTEIGKSIERLAKVEK